MTWQLVLTPHAERDIRNLDRAVAARVMAAAERFAATGRGAVIRLATPEHGADYRLSVGDWRVLFNLEPQDRALVVARVRHRSGAYRG